MTAPGQEAPAAAREPWRQRGADGRHLPGDFDMWVLVLGDMFFFGCYFVTYMAFRARSTAAFTSAQQHLNVGIGVANTVLLLTSSMLVARAVTLARRGSPEAARRLIFGAGACGVVFCLLKAYEWHAEISKGFTVSNEFFSFYFVLTGIHVLHLLLGLLVLAIAARELRNPGKRRIGVVEQCAIYWHMVDLLWIVIFATLYLMR
jgi:nitric oxide reductase NorE protein